MQKYISQIIRYAVQYTMFGFLGFNKNTHYNTKTKIYTPSKEMQWEELEQCLKNPYFRPEVSWKFENLPEIIDIGKIGDLGEKLLKESKNDPQHRERGTYVKLDIYDKLLARKAEFADIGNEFSVDINHVLEGYSQFRYGDTTEKLAAVIHTHPRQYEDQQLLDVPSFLDISGLLTMNPSAPSISVIYVQKRKENKHTSHILMIRTKETPLMEYEAIDLWMENLNRRFYGILNSNETNAIEIARRLILQSAHDKNIGIYFSKGTSKFKKSRAL